MNRKSKESKIKWKYVILVMITTSVIVFDQLTKSWILNRFRLGETIPIISNFFNLTYVQNKGAAFGLLAQADPRFRIPFFIVVPMIALASIIYVFQKISDKDKKLATALSLVIAGAVGNLIDRLSLGYVVDFLDFHWGWTYHFPAFNVADSAICIGVGLIMLDLVTQDGASSVKKGAQAHVSSAR